MACKGCGEAGGHHKPGCGFSPTVLQITNKDCTLFHNVTIPAIMGDETEVPPTNGLYKNVLLYYEASGNAYFYSSDGIPTKLTYATTDYNALTNKPTINGVTLEGNQSSSSLGININDATLTIKQGDTTLGTFSANASENVEINVGGSATHLIPVIEDGAIWDEWQQTKDRSHAAWRLLSCDKVSFNVSGTSETMSLQEVFDALENGAEYVFDSLPLDEVDPVILGLNPPEYPEVSGVAVPSRQSFSYVAGPDPATNTINVIFRSGSAESILIPHNDDPRVYKVMTGVLKQDQTGVESKYLFMLGRVISTTPIN